MFFQDIFKDHLRHAARSAADHLFTDEIFPPEVGVVGTADHKISRPLGELSEVHQIIFIPFVILINGCLRTHQGDICVAAYDGRGALVGAKTGGDFQIDALILKISKLHGHILRRIKDGMGHLI